MRLPANDPRTLARDIPGLFDALFPQLVPGVVAHLNQSSRPASSCQPVPKELLDGSDLHRAMLFEIAVAVTEWLLAEGEPVDWDECVAIAVKRQRRHFDAKEPGNFSPTDQAAALWVARNLVVMLREIEADTTGGRLVRSPEIPGYEWIASGVGDFAVGTRLIEVKCTNRHFSSADYRQILMYWLLGYAASLEHEVAEWSEAVLVNPRRNLALRVSFDDLISVTGAGRNKVELLEQFFSIVGDFRAR